MATKHLDLIDTQVVELIERTATVLGNFRRTSQVLKNHNPELNASFETLLSAEEKVKDLEKKSHTATLSHDSRSSYGQ